MVWVDGAQCVMTTSANQRPGLYVGCWASGKSCDIAQVTQVK